MPFPKFFDDVSPLADASTAIDGFYSMQQLSEIVKVNALFICPTHVRKFFLLKSPTTAV